MTYFIYNGLFAATSPVIFDSTLNGPPVGNKLPKPPQSEKRPPVNVSISIILKDQKLIIDDNRQVIIDGQKSVDMGYGTERKRRPSGAWQHEPEDNYAPYYHAMRRKANQTQAKSEDQKYEARGQPPDKFSPARNGKETRRISGSRRGLAGCSS
ncbi:hypothetical protein Asppvi_003983 [Aspergillus pseudoviridinutans]|uniref:Uncharacterized protein n=1 Tax=Aspergillus pseudoviridinutans TaxID=1517512 RepID=A0A9P3B5Q1_9EURO|nr:uncharacterized protein Asppvi_003983 [Aspergillus pseudoviridinutans]GIJ85127.1 hypothetical protein Asppvi_003983 [Aspergillus pseudoviridinutans]